MWWFLSYINMDQPWVYIHVSPTSWTPLPPPSPSYPSRLSQNTGFGCPLHASKTLFICLTYSNVYVSRLFLQIILLFPFPTESKYLFLFNFYLNMLENTLAFINSSHICGVSMFKAHTGEHEKVEWHSFCFLNGNCVKGVFSLRHSLSHCNLFWLYPIFFPFISVLFSCSNCKLCLHTF